MEDAGLAAFSVFFTQSPSLLGFQTRMQKERGRTNAAALFRVARIPGDRQIGNLPDPVDPAHLARLSLALLAALRRGGAPEAQRTAS